MLRAFEPCIPTRSKVAPSGPNWIHEIKHDGYRIIVRREGKSVRLFTRNGADFTGRFPWIVEAAGALKVASITIDGEACVVGDDGISDFNRLHSRAWDRHALLYAFDLLELDGEDLRPRPLDERKAKLARTLNLGRRLNDTKFAGILYNDHATDPGPVIFEHACRMGLEGVVSKRRDFPYKPGRCKAWLKIKNPAFTGNGAIGGRAVVKDQQGSIAVILRALCGLATILISHVPLSRHSLDQPLNVRRLQSLDGRENTVNRVAHITAALHSSFTNCV